LKTINGGKYLPSADTHANTEIDSLPEPPTIRLRGCHFSLIAFSFEGSVWNLHSSAIKNN